MNLTNVLVKLRDDIKIWTTNNLSELKTRLNTHANTAEIHTTANEKNKVHLTNIGYGECATAANVAEKTVTITTNPEWKLEPGAMVFVKFTNTNTATDVTLNVNETGPKSIWGSSAIVTGTSSAYTGYKNRIISYVYDGTQYIWTGSSHMVSYSNASLGQGYATCSTAAATAAKTASISSSFAYTTGGTVSIRFTNGNTASKPTLNINSKGAKNIYFNNAALTDTSLIKAGDVVTFMYSSNFHIIAINGVSVTAGAYGPSSNITLSPTNKTFTVPQITTDQTGRITGAANRTMTLPNFALSDTIGGSAKMAKAVNITRPTKSILEAAGDMDLFTEKVFFFGSDGFTYGAPSNYVIINAKKGANHRTILDCYSLQTGDHYINGCMYAETENMGGWTGWILQPNPTSLQDTLSQAKTYTNECLKSYYTKTQIDNLNLISVAEIDAICGATIQVANEGVKF